MAQHELEDAVSKAGMNDRERMVVPTAADKGQTLYRARIVRLSEIEAAAGCEALKDKQVACFIVSDE